MKELVRKILKEETSDSNIQKGIDIMVQFVKNKFPFIKYGKFMDNTSFAIEINLYCDPYKTSEFYQSEIKDYYLDKLEDDDGFSYPTSILIIHSLISSDKKYEFYEKINKSLNFYYDLLPEEYRLFDTWGKTKQIEVDKFFFTK